MVKVPGAAAMLLQPMRMTDDCTRLVRHTCRLGTAPPLHPVSSCIIFPIQAWCLSRASPSLVQAWHGKVELSHFFFLRS